MYLRSYFNFGPRPKEIKEIKVKSKSLHGCRLLPETHKEYRQYQVDMAKTVVLKKKHSVVAQSMPLRALKRACTLICQMPCIPESPDHRQSERQLNDEYKEGYQLRRKSCECSDCGIKTPFQKRSQLIKIKPVPRPSRTLDLLKNFRQTLLRQQSLLHAPVYIKESKEDQEGDSFSPLLKRFSHTQPYMPSQKILRVKQPNFKSIQDEDQSVHECRDLPTIKTRRTTFDTIIMQQKNIMNNKKKEFYRHKVKLDRLSHSKQTLHETNVLTPNTTRSVISNKNTEIQKIYFRQPKPFRISKFATMPDFPA